MRHWTRVIMCLFALLLGSLMLEPYVRFASGHLGEDRPAFITPQPAQPIAVAATVGRIYFTQRSSCVIRIVDDNGQRDFATIAGCLSDIHIAVAGPAVTTAASNAAGRWTSPTPAGFSSNYVYAITQVGNPQAPDTRVFEISEARVVSSPAFATVPNCGAHAGIAFDLVHSTTPPVINAFGNNIIVTCSTGNVYIINNLGQFVDANGTVTGQAFVNAAQALGLPTLRLENSDIAPASFGSHVGSLFVAAPDIDRILRISRTGQVTRFARLTGAEAIDFISSSRCTFGTTDATYFTTILSPSQAAGIYQFPRSFFPTGTYGIGVSETNGDMSFVNVNNVRRAHANFGQHEDGVVIPCSVPRIIGILTDLGVNQPRRIPASNGETQVGILASPAFNPLTDIKPDSTPLPDGSPSSGLFIRYGVSGIQHSIRACERTRDINGDGRDDLTCRAENRFLGIPPAQSPWTLPLIMRLKYKVTTPSGVIDPDGEGFN